MSSPRRSKKPERHFYNRDYRDGYVDSEYDNKNIYPRNYAPWQWGYWTADNMAYSGSEGAYYVQDDQGRGRPGYFAGNVYDNAGYYGSKSGRGGGSYKLKSSSSDGLAEYPGERPRRNAGRRCIVVSSIVGLVFLLGAALAIGIYFGVVDKPEKAPPEPTTTPAPAPVLSADVSLTLNQPYDPDLGDPSTNAYKTLEGKVINEIDESMKNGPQASAYSGVQVSGFSEGSTIAHVILSLTSSNYRSNNVVVAITAANVASELKAGLQTKSTTLVDVNTVTAVILQATGSSFLGESCTKPEDCAFKDPVCTGLTSSVCQCGPSLYDSNGDKPKGVCLPKKAIGGKCANATNCKTSRSVCSGTPLVCSCGDEKYYMENTDSCNTKLQQGDTGCTNATLQCQVPGAMCVDEKCACATGYQLKDNTCVKLLEHGESGCSVDTDCSTAESVCGATECTCVSVDFFDQDTNACKDKLQQGDTGCTNATLQCQVPGAMCVDEKCACATGYQLKDNACVKSLEHGESGCSVNTDCSTSESVCEATKCTCVSGDYFDKDANACKDKLQQGDTGCTNATLQCHVPGAMCVDEKCACATGYQLKENACVKLIDHGESGCTVDTDCSTADILCEETVCTCVSGDYFDKDANACKDKLQQGDTGCTNATLQCHVPGAMCVDEKCACATGYQLKENACVKSLEHGESGCSVNTDCSTSESVCEATKCTCVSGDYFDKDANACKDKLQQGDTGCTNATLQCHVPGAMCVDEKCACATGYQLKENACVKLIDHGESGCTVDTDCSTADILCEETVCTCVSGDYFDKDANACKDKLQQGDTGCTNATLQCHVPGAMCVDEKCACATGYQLKENACVKSLEHGESGCSVNTDCSTSESVCEATKCTCVSGDYFDKDANACKDKLQQGDTGCTNATLQCHVPGAMCVDEKCACATGYQLKENACVKLIDHGESGCTVDTDCSTADILCEETVCTCVSGDYFDKDANACKDKLQQGDSGCTNATLQCHVPGAMCVDEKCACATGYQLKDNACVKLIDHGESGCTVDTDCSTADILCEETVCTCVSGDYFDKDANACKDKLDYKAKGCEDAPLQCKTKDAVCLNETCDCDMGFYYKDEQCLPQSEQGAACDTYVECKIKKAVCDVICLCETGKYSDGTMCKPKVDYGIDCDQDAMCTTFGGICTTSKCGCRDDYVHDSINDKCILKKMYNESCSSDVDCITEKAKCISSLCQCSSGQFLDATICADKKENGEICDSKEECKAGGAICNDVCDCEDDEYYDVSCKAKVGLNVVCSNTNQCFLGGAECSDTCKCPDKTYAADTSCLPVKPFENPCTEDKECETSTCDKNQCGCLATHYYDLEMKICQIKVQFEGECTDPTHCVTGNAVCSGKCECADDSFLNGNDCFKRLNNGESCSTDDDCFFKDSKCIASSCTCGVGTFVNTEASSCDPKKNNTEPCSVLEQCVADGAICSETCQCEQDSYLEGSACLQKKPNKVSCKTQGECKATGSDCLDGMCDCPPTMFLSGEECVSRLGLGSDCTEKDQCEEGYMCTDSMCDCPTGFTFVSSNCMMVTTTTALPTTVAPDPVLVIETESKLVSNETFDPALADNTSLAYIEKAAAVEDACKAGFQNETGFKDCKVTGIEPGSIQFTILITNGKIDVYAEGEIEDTPEIDKETKFSQFVTDLVDKALEAVVKTLEEKGVLKEVSRTKPVQKKKPCEDEALCVNRSRTSLCEPVRKYSVSVSGQDRCSGYLDLLNCVALQYRRAGTECDWNMMRFNMEKFAVEDLGLPKSAVAKCVPGNLFQLLSSVYDSNPCQDITALRLTYYGCKNEFKRISRGKIDTRCSNVPAAVKCSKNVLDGYFESQCSEESIRKTLVDGQDKVLGKNIVGLEACEFCAPPNILNIWKKKCGLTMPLMETATPDTACSYLHMEKKCIERELMSWTTSSCTSEDVMDMFRNDERFLNYGKMHLSWLNKEHWNNCLDNPPQFGPPEPESVCQDQIYIGYFLFTKCWIKEMDEESCIPFYESAECVRKMIKDSTGVSCLYKEIEKSIMANSSEYYTISQYLSADGKLNQCIIGGTVDVCDSSMIFMMYTKPVDIITSCLSLVNTILYFPTLDQMTSYNGKYDYSCRIYWEAEMCMMGLYGRELKECTPDQFEKHIHTLIQGLVQGGITEAIKVGTPAPSFGVDIYKKCEGSLPSMDCTSSDVVIDTLIASCAGYVAIEQTSKCQTFDACKAGMKDWHSKNDDICPGFIETLESDEMTDDMAYTFWTVSGLNWNTCSEETEILVVVIWFASDTYNVDFADINSEDARIYILSKWDLLHYLSAGREVEVTGLSTVGNERKKRETEPSSGNGGVVVNVDIPVPKGQKPDFEVRLANRAENVKILSVRQKSEREGNCPVAQAYNDRCNGFRDQCSSDEDCTIDGQKCCSDGDAKFCVNSTTTAAMFRLAFRLTAEQWDSVYTNIENDKSQRLITRYTSIMTKIISEGNLDVDMDTLSLRQSGKQVLVDFTFSSFVNPETRLKETLKKYPNANIRLEELFFISPGIEGTDRCPADLLTTDSFITCVEEQFKDWGYYYQDYQICDPVMQLANCVLEKCSERGVYTACDHETITNRMMRERAAIIKRVEELSTEASFDRILKALGSYNATRCREQDDIDPCRDVGAVKKAVKNCEDYLKDVDYLDLYSPKSCRALNKFASCVLVGVRNQGSQWCDLYQLKDTLWTAAGESVSISPDEFNEKCGGYMPICTYTGLTSLTYSLCDVSYFQEKSCSNATVRQAVSDYIFCARRTILRTDEDCSVDKIVEMVFETDRYRLGILDQNVKTDECITDATLNAIKEELPDKDSVCRSTRAMRHYYMDCFPVECPLQLKEIQDVTARCTLLLQQVLCIQRNMKNESFECKVNEVMDASVGQMGQEKTFPIYLSKDLLDQCEGILFPEDSSLDKCEQPLLSRTNGSMECVQHLLHDLSDLPQEEQCNLVSVGARCLNTVKDEVNAECNQEDIVTTLRHIITASDVGLKQAECKYEESASAKSYPDCEEISPTFDLCHDSRVTTLLKLTEVECKDKYQREEKNFTFFRDNFNIDELTLTCRAFNVYTNCSQSVLERLKYTCPKEDVRKTIADNKEALSNSLASKNLDDCFEGSCRARVKSQVHKCLCPDMLYQMYDGDWPCRLYNMLWHCVKSGLESGVTCDDDLIRNQTFLQLYNPYDSYSNYGWMKCNVTAKRPDICTDVTAVYRLSECSCMDSFHNLTDSCKEEVKEKAIKCVKDVINMFGDCESDSVRSLAISTIIYRSRQYYMPGIEDCFSEIKKDGFCPVMSNTYCCRNDYEDKCFIDSTCPDNTKCCSDGCKRTCLPPLSKVTLMITVMLEKETWTYEYNDTHSDMAQTLINNNMKYFDLGDTYFAGTPRVTSLRWSTDGVILTFETDSYGDETELEGVIKTHFAQFVTVTYMYTGRNKETDTAQKEGTCPRYSLDVFDDQVGCCHDYSCSGEMKCCGFQNKYGMYCVNPIKGELKECNDTLSLAAASIKCGLNPLDTSALATEIAKYTCSDIFDKLNCILDEINKDRPPFTGCSLGGLLHSMRKLLQNAEMTEEQMKQVMSRFECKEWELLLTVRPDNCSLENPAFVAYNEKKTTVLGTLEEQNGYKLRQEFCRNEEFRTLGRLYSSEYQYDLESRIYELFKNFSEASRKKRQIDSLFPSVSLQAVNLTGVDWCVDTDVAKRFSLDCARQYIHATYDDFEKCRPTFDFFDCVRNKYFQLPDRQIISYEGCQMSDNELQSVVLPYLRSTLPTNFTAYLNKLASYNSKKCVSRYSDKSPCEDATKMAEAYSECSKTYPISTYSTISPEFCKAFYKLTSCMTVKLRKYGARCYFYRAEEHVYNAMKNMTIAGSSLPEYYYMLNCSEYKPVCSASYIQESRYGRCGMNMNMTTSISEYNSCSNESQKMTIKMFASCLAIDAIVKGEKDCTLIDILDIVEEDKYKLSIFNKSVMISTCISEEEKQALSSELTYGQGLCESGMFIAYLAHGCEDSNHYYCYGTTLQNIPPEPSCKYLAPVMSCVKRNMSESLQLECNLPDLIDTTLPANSRLSTSAEVRSECKDELSKSNCVRDALLKNSKKVMSCVKATYEDAVAPIAGENPSCSVYVYTLTCLKSLLPEDCEASVSDINGAYYDVLEYIAVDKSLNHCYDYMEPNAFPGCEVPTTLLEDNSCSNTKFVADVVMHQCARQFSNMTDMYEGNDGAACLVYSGLLSCGINATGRLLSSSEEKERLCTRDEVNTALQQHTDLVSETLSIKPSKCQNACYLDMIEVVKRCINATLGADEYDRFNNSWQRSCRAYRFIYQCVDRAMPDCENEVKLMALNHTLSPYRRQVYSPCKDPRYQLRLDMCKNATDLMAVSQSKCGHFIRSVTNTSVELQQHGKCNNQTELKSCMTTVIRNYTEMSSGATEAMPCGEYTDQIILKASLMAIRKPWMYNVKEMERSSAVIKACFDENDRTGSCPYIENRLKEDVSNCTLDTECQDETNKCCFSGSSFSCRPPYTKQERYEVRIRLNGTEYQWQFYDLQSNETQKAIGEQLKWINDTCNKKGWRCESFRAEEYKSYYRKKRQLTGNATSDTVIGFNLYSTSNTKEELMKEIKTAGKPFAVLTFSFSPEETQGFCPGTNYECHNYTYSCESDYNCRVNVKHGIGYKCCYQCGHQCVLMGDPDKCGKVIDKHWSDCSAGLNITKEFGSVASYDPWSTNQCRLLQNITKCISAKNTEMCGDSFFSEKVFGAIIEKLGKNPYYYSYPKDCGNVCMDNGTTRKHGEEFDSMDGCNTCMCIYGKINCTREECSRCPAVKAGEYCPTDAACHNSSVCPFGEICCEHSSCGYRICAKPEEPTKKEDYLVVLALLNETYNETYKNLSSKPARDMIKRITPFLDDLFNKTLNLPYRLVSVENQRRRKRQAPVVPEESAHAYVQTQSNGSPDEKISNAIEKSSYLKKHLAFQRSSMIDEEECYDFEAIYNKVKDKCDKNLDIIFSQEKTTEDKCRAYNEHKKCIKKEMVFCGDIDPFIDGTTWSYFNLLKRDGKIQGDWFMLDTGMCSADNLCWSDKSIQEVTIGNCFNKLEMLGIIYTNKMDKEVCRLSWELVKCVTESLNMKMNYMYTCNKEEIEIKVMKLISSLESLQEEIPLELPFDVASFDIEYCKELPCYPSGLKALAKGSCADAWNAYGNEDNCIHVTMFVGCAMFNSLGKEDTCTMQEIIEMTKEVGMEMWSTTGNVSRNFSLCPAKCYGKWEVADDISVRWILSSNNRTNATFVIELPSNDWAEGKWIGLGVSDDQKMVDSDIVTAEWHAGANPVVINRYAFAYSLPPVDTMASSYSARFLNEDSKSSIDFERPGPKIDGDKDKTLSGGLYLLFAKGDIMSGDIVYHGSENRFFSPSKFNFTCSSNQLEEEFPGPTEVCEYWGGNHYNLRYGCPGFSNLSSLTDEEKCLAKEYAIGCVNERMKDFGCTMQQTRTAFDDPRTVEGVFDKNPDCTSIVSGLNECEQLILSSGQTTSDKCLGSAVTFTFLEMYGLPSEDIMGPETTKPLKCRLFEDAVGCYMKEKDYSVNNVKCDKASYKNMVNHFLLMYQKIAVAAFNVSIPMLDVDDFEPINFGDCSIGTDIVADYSVCPADNVIVEHIMARCLSSLLIAVKYYMPNGGSLCQLEPLFTNCSTSSEIVRLQSCSLEDKMVAVAKHDKYINDISGYSPNSCTGYAQCQATFYQQSDCIGKYVSLYLLAPQMNLSQKCTLSAHYEAEVRSCAKEVHQCNQHVDSFIDAVRQNPTFQIAFPMRANCTDNINMCQALHQFGVMECGWFMQRLADPDFTCLMRNCFNNLKIPEECGFVDREALAYEAIYSTYGYPLGKCERKVCLTEDKTVLDGEYIKAVDDCNNCYCNKGQMLCTKKPCTPETWRIDLLLQNEAWNQDFGNLNTPAAMNLLEKINTMVNKLLNKWEDWKILGFFQRNDRTKRQAPGEVNPDEATVLRLTLKAIENPEEYIQNDITNDAELREIFKFLSISQYEPSPCTPEYFDLATEDKCTNSWQKLTDSKTNDEQCRHYVQFVSCVLYQDVIDDGHCTLEDVHNAMKNRTREKGLAAEFCPDNTNFTMSFVKKVFPENKGLICTNWYVNKHLLEYYCLYVEQYKAADPGEKCWMEFAARKCVNGVTADVGCTLAQTNSVFQNPLLRKDVLDTTAECDFDECLEDFTEHSYCAMKYTLLPSIAHQMNFTQRCTILNHYQKEAKECLESVVPDCDDYTDAYISGTGQAPYMAGSFPNRNKCSDDDLKECTVLHQVGIMDCGWIVSTAGSDPAGFTCKMRNCFRNLNIPKECGYVNREDLATKAIFETYGFVLDECDEQACMYYDSMKKNGESFGSVDGCNTCSCMNGTVACTLMECTTCMYNGTMREIGDQFDSMDGCNTCFCGENGTVGCTEMACLRTYIVKLQLLNYTYNASYSNSSSSAYMNLRRLLDKLFHGIQYIIESTYPLSPERRKRQAPGTSDSGAGLGVEVHVYGNVTMEGLTAAANNLTGADKGRVRVQSVVPVEVDKCATVKCAEPMCKNHTKPVGECCEVCTLECAKWVNTVNCVADPCMGQTCEKYSDAKCVSNYCGGCNAQFIHFNGEDVTEECKAREPDVCNKELDKGNCTNNKPSWYYNTKTQQCEKFNYTGCAGNENRFTTEAGCLRLCELDCAKVNCSAVDCKSKEQHCCESCSKEKPGQCPRFDDDQFGICLYQCDKDSDCNGTAKCCENPCGKAQCLEPLTEDAVCSEIFEDLKEMKTLAEYPCRVLMQKVREGVSEANWQFDQGSILKCLFGKLDEAKSEVVLNEFLECGTYIVQLLLLNASYSEEYANLSSPVTMQYITTLTPVLESLFQEWEILKIWKEPYTERVKRQVPDSHSNMKGVGIAVQVDEPVTKKDLEAKAESITGEYMGRVVVKSANLSFVDKCADVRCVALQCKNRTRPQGKCCEECTIECNPDAGVADCKDIPCMVTNCTNYPHAMCVDNYCGGCNAQFIYNGTDVTAMCEDKGRDVCSKSLDNGTCTNAFPSWYYNNKTQQCEKFNFTGCKGNENRFNTQAQCLKLCELDCAKVNCSAVDCKSKEQHCCESCSKEKEGYCPPMDRNTTASICLYECGKDSECADDKKCCRNSCGQAQCLDPVAEDPLTAVCDTITGELMKAYNMSGDSIEDPCTLLRTTTESQLKQQQWQFEEHRVIECVLKKIKAAIPDVEIDCEPESETSDRPEN